jgi:predicted DNA-binding transcriptional regulator YafY
MAITIERAARDKVEIQIKYWPNKDGQERTGWRTVLPLDLYTYRRVRYLLTWFTSGSSVSGTIGYRLFFVKNIRDIREVDTSSQRPFAMARAPRINAWNKAFEMIHKGEIE